MAGLRPRSVVGLVLSRCSKPRRIGGKHDGPETSSGAHQRQGKDGNPAFSQYVKDHPTNYIWRADIERLTARLVNMDPFYRRIWVNTYFIHPPGVPLPRRDTLSFDVWGFGGRGAPLDVNLGWQVRQLLFNDPNLPNINWTIWQGKMWWFQGNPQLTKAPLGPPGSDAGHFQHLHVTYF